MNARSSKNLLQKFPIAREGSSIIHVNKIIKAFKKILIKNKNIETACIHLSVFDHSAQVLCT